MLATAPLTYESIIGGSTLVGIALALIGGVVLALGAQGQHKGVAAVTRQLGATRRDSGLRGRELLGLLSSPWWVAGTIMSCGALVLQIASLLFAPLIVVQPLGVIALAVIASVNSHVSRVRLNSRAIRAIVLCIVGVGVFVVAATLVAEDHPVTDTALLATLATLATVITVLALAYIVVRRRASAVFYMVAAGVLYGFVASIAKILLNRLASAFGGVAPAISWVDGACFAGMVLAMGLGAYFVQSAYAIGAPDLVVAGLTVIDPIVAVSVGVLLLGEVPSPGLSTIFVWLVAGAVATVGVLELAKHHPQTQRISAHPG